MLAVPPGLHLHGETTIEADQRPEEAKATTSRGGLQEDVGSSWSETARTDEELAAEVAQIWSLS